MNFEIKLDIGEPDKELEVSVYRHWSGALSEVESKINTSKLKIRKVCVHDCFIPINTCSNFDLVNFRRDSQTKLIMNSFLALLT